VGHDRRVPAVAPHEPTETCPGCGGVLVRASNDPSPHAGASTSCARLFRTTLRGLREEAAADPAAATIVGIADAAYDAQHVLPDAVPDAVGRLAVALGVTPTAPRARTPRAWRTTIADVAADLDVIDLAVLVEAWARSVHEDWCGVPTGG
jgi:hypothetical protein